MTKLKDKILDKIEKQNIEPTPKSHFDWMERAKWMLIGIFSVFSIMFIGFLIDDALEIITYGPGFLKGPGLRFFLPPLIWIIVIGIGMYFAIKEFRKTNSGYKYSIRFIIGIGLILFFLAPLLSFRIGLGTSMHGVFVDRVPFVGKFIYDESSWDDPENGKLGGEILLISGSIIDLKTRDGKVWKVDSSKSYQTRKFEFTIGERLRTDGKLTGSGIFMAEKIFPWFGRGGMTPGGSRGGFNKRGMMKGDEKGGGRDSEGKYLSGSVR